jgi:hypothetical protein
MSPEGNSDLIAVGTRVSFPYGGSRRTGTVADVSILPDGAGGKAVAYLIDVGSRKVFVQGEGITPATSAPATPFDPVAEGVAYGRKRPRTNPRRH